MLNANNLLTDYSKEILAICYLGNHDFNNCIKTLESMHELRYQWYALAYEGLNDQENAIYYWTKQLDLSIVNNDFAAAGLAAHSLGSIYYDSGEIYHLCDYEKAIYFLQKSLNYYDKAKDLPLETIWNKSVGSQPNSEVESLRREIKTLDYTIFMLVNSLYQQAQWTYNDWKSTIIALAKNKNKIARDLCEKKYWSY